MTTNYDDWLMDQNAWDRKWGNEPTDEEKEAEIEKKAELEFDEEHEEGTPSYLKEAHNA